MENAVVFKQLQQPIKLELWAKCKVICWIISLVEINGDSMSYVPELDTKETEEMTRKIKIVRDYFEDIPAVFARELFLRLKYRLSLMPHLVSHNKRLAESNLSPSDRLYATVRWIEVLFTKYVNILYLNSHTIKIFKTSFTSFLYLLTGLTELHIYAHINPNSEEEATRCSEYAEILKRIPNLKKIRLDSRSERLLRCIIENCKSLVTIDLYRYYTISTDTFDELIRLPNLVTVCLHDSFDEYLFNPSGLQAKKIEIWKYIALHQQFRIKLLLMTNEVTDQNLKIIEKFDMIENVEYVNMTGDFVPRSLDTLKCLARVRDLKILTSNFYQHQVVELLQVVGKNLVNLLLSEVNRVDVQALMLICLLCPNLQALTIRVDSFFATDYKQKFESYASLFKDVTTESLRFFNLRIFKLTAGLDGNKFETPQPYINQMITIILLHNCPNLEFIDLKLDFTDDFLMKVFEKNPLKSLKELRMVRRVNDEVIEHIIKNCSAAEVIIDSNVENFGF